MVFYRSPAALAISDAIVHHGRLDSGVLLLAKPYRKPELARMIRMALDNGHAVEQSAH